MGLELFPYQSAGVAFLQSRRRAALFDEMGLGKTVQALAAIPPGAPAVVVCPRIVRPVWADHARDLFGLEADELEGRNSFRWSPPGRLAVLNFEILPSKAPDGPPPGTVLIADEAHYLKNWKSLRSKRFRALSRAVLRAGGSVWVLTGTPQTNDPPDLWSVLDAADLAWKAFGSWQAFERGFAARREEIRVRGGRPVRVIRWGTASPWVREAVQRVALRRTRAEVLPELPPKLRRRVRVECLDEEALRLCDAALERLRELGRDPREELERIIEAGESFCEEMARARSALAVLKIRAAGELLDELEAAGRPVVLFSAHRAPVEAVSASRPGWAALLGGMPNHVRERVVRDFQAGRLRGVAATIQAAGTGITLTASADVVFVDLSFTPAENSQAEDRVCRIGQNRGVSISILEADHELDRIVAGVLSRKLAVVDSIL